MSTETLQDRASKFIQWLTENRNDPGVMASLRRGFSEATEHYAWPHVAQFCPLDNDRLRTIYVTVAACYAFHPECTDQGNLGTTLRRIALSQEAGDDPLSTYRGRFNRLITATTVDEICQQLRPIIQAAKPRMIPINYTSLLVDLLRWDYAARDVKVEWAQEYYGTPTEQLPAEEEEAESESATVNP